MATRKATLFERHLRPRVEAALTDTPVVLVVGPRQAGKTTLCGQVAEKTGARLLSFDDAATLASATADPAGFIAALEGPVVLDEIQKAPALLPAIKHAVDRRREAGRFLLTGSASVLALPKIAESLAGRMEVLTLWPLSQGELLNREEGFLGELFRSAAPRLATAGETRAELIERALRGGYPEAVQRTDPERRRAWFGSYVTTILQRDVRDLADIAGLADLPRVLQVLAARTYSMANAAELSRTIGIPLTTLKRYLALLEHTFLIRSVPAWTGNRGLRVIRTPRVLIPDTGLLADLAGLTSERLAVDSPAIGPLLESFVASELLKQISVSRTRIDLLHFRTHAGREVDFVLESASGGVVGIEVKAAATVSAAHTRGLAALREAAGRKFHRGVLLYGGRESLPFGRDIWAMPISSLWAVAGGARPSR